MIQKKTPFKNMPHIQFDVAARALATYSIPGCIGRGVRLGFESSPGGGAGGFWKSGNLEIWEFGDLGTWKSGNLEIWGPGNPEMWGPTNSPGLGPGRVRSWALGL